MKSRAVIKVLVIAMISSVMTCASTNMIGFSMTIGGPLLTYIFLSA